MAEYETYLHPQKSVIDLAFAAEPKLETQPVEELPKAGKPDDPLLRPFLKSTENKTL